MLSDVPKTSSVSEPGRYVVKITYMARHDGSGWRQVDSDRLSFSIVRAEESDDGGSDGSDDGSDEVWSVSRPDGSGWEKTDETRPTERSYPVTSTGGTPSALQILDQAPLKNPLSAEYEQVDTTTETKWATDKPGSNWAKTDETRMADKEYIDIIETKYRKTTYKYRITEEVTETLWVK